MCSVDSKRGAGATKKLKISLCNGCLSFDRELKPLGEKVNVFCMFVNDTYSKFFDILLCWECMAVLRKVELFKEKVAHAQMVLSKSFHLLNSESILPEPLSTLAYKKVNFYTNGTLNPLIDYYNDLDLEIKEENEETVGDIINPEVPLEAMQNDFLGESFVNDSDIDDTDQIEDNISESSSDFMDLSLKIGQPKNCSDSTKKHDENTDSKRQKSFANDSDIDNTDQIEDNISESSSDFMDVSLKIGQRKNFSDSRKKHDGNTDSKRQKSSDNDTIEEKEPKSKDRVKIKKVKSKKTEDEDPDYIPEETTTVSKKKSWYKRKSDRYSKVFVIHSQHLNNHFKKVEVDKAEMLACMEKDRNSEFFRNIKSKCEKCVLPLSEPRLKKHNEQCHIQTAERNLFCDLCEQIFKKELDLTSHFVRTHAHIRQCLVCDTRISNTTLVKLHLKIHAAQVQCSNCGLTFSSQQAFKKHYEDMHSKFICDYCGDVETSKSRLVAHIKEQQHMRCYCRQCNKYYSSYKTYDSHVKIYHTTQTTEQAFCVECNIRFKNVYAFKQHLYGSRAHNREKYEKAKQMRHKCPDCPKEYGSKFSLMNHHDYVHKGVSRHICPHCNQQFLRRSRVREHIRSVHLKLKPEKNKMCYICGRGFSHNLILTHHIRTHTGERPHHCPHCDASFAQKVAMNSHIKNIHLKAAGGTVS